MCVSLPRACISSSSSSTSSSRRNWRKSSSCNSSSCPSTPLETWLRTPSSWTPPACIRRARAPAAPARPPGPPTTRCTPAALPPGLAPAPSWSRMTRVKRAAVWCCFLFHLITTREPQGTAAFLGAAWGYEVPFPRVHSVLTSLPPTLGARLLLRPMVSPLGGPTGGPLALSPSCLARARKHCCDQRCTVLRAFPRQPGAKDKIATVGSGQLSGPVF